MFMLLAASFDQVYSTDQKFMNVDLFAGKAEIAKSFKRRGLRSVALDLERSKGDAACHRIISLISQSFSTICAETNCSLGRTMLS